MTKDTAKGEPDSISANGRNKPTSDVREKKKQNAERTYPTKQPIELAPQVYSQRMARGIGWKEKRGLWGGKKAWVLGVEGLWSGQAVDIVAGWIWQGYWRWKGMNNIEGRSASLNRHIVERCRRRTNLPMSEPSPYKRETKAEKHAAKQMKREKEIKKKRRKTIFSFPPIFLRVQPC